MDLYFNFFLFLGGMVEHMYGVNLNTKIKGNFENQNNTINSFKKK